MQVVNTKNQCFAVWSDEIEGRLNPYYYKPEFRDLESKISKLNCKKIQDISFDLKNGSTPSGGVFEKSGIPYFRSQDFNLFDFKINQFISEEFHKKLNRSAIKPSDVLLAVVGATLGVVGYVPENIKKGNINQNIVRIRVKDKSVNNKYLAIVLASDIGQKLILRNATITTQAYLNNSQLGNIKIPIPSLKIQNQIIEIMQSAYKEKAEKETEAENLLNSIDDYVLDELDITMPEIKDKMCFGVESEEVVRNRLDSYYYQPKFKELENALKKGKYKLIEINQKLRILTELEDISKYDFIKYIDLASINKDLGIVEDYKELRLLKAPSRAKQKVEKGDLLLSSLQGSLKSIAIVEDNFDNFIVSTGFYVIKKLENYNNYYLWAIFRNSIYQILLNRMATGAIMSAINRKDLENLKIPLPPPTIQNAIAEEVENRIEKAKKLKLEAKNIVENTKKEVEKIILSK